MSADYYTVHRHSGKRANELCTVFASGPDAAMKLARKWFKLPRGSYALFLGREGYAARLARESALMCGGAA